MTAEQANHHIATAEQLWIDRSRRSWRLDLRMLTDAGLPLTSPPQAGSRGRAADGQLAREQAGLGPARP